MYTRKIWSILKGTFNEFFEDKVLRLSAALAYYAMFSIGPLLVIAVGLAGLAFGHDSVRREIEHQLQSMLGAKATATVSSMMAVQKHSSSLLTTIMGLAALLFGATGVFGQLQDSLNTIWEVKARPGSGVWNYLRARFLSLLMVLGTGFLLLVSMALTTFLTAMTGFLGSKLPVPVSLAHILNLTISFAVITLLFAMIFKYLPDVEIPFGKVWIGAFGTALLFTAGKYALATYLGRESTTSTYGAAGSVIVLLIWVYYASIILFFGAEFTQVFAKQTGTHVVPSNFAERVSLEDRAQQGIPHEHSPEPVIEEPGLPLNPLPQSPRPLLTPGMVAQQHPIGVLGLALLIGFAGGLLLRFKDLRKAPKLSGSTS
jgi:membrane protein